MKTRRSWIMALILVLVGCASAPATPRPTRTPRPSPTVTPTLDAEDGDVLQVFEDYRAALLQVDGAAAVDLVDAGTIDWYEDTLGLALSASRSELNRLDALQKFMVLRLRLDLAKADLEALTGRSLFVYAVDHGWILSEEAESMRLGRVEVQEDAGEAWVSIEQAPDMPLFYMVKQDGHWRIALWQSLASTNRYMEQAISGSGLSEDAFMLQALESYSGSQVDERIFEGPLE